MKAGWKIKTLGDVVLKISTVDPAQSPDIEFDYIDVSSVSNRTFQIEETQRLKGKDAPSRARRLVRTNDVLFATVRPTLRRIAIVPAGLDKQVCSTGYFVMRPNPEVDHRFIFYFLQDGDFMAQMEKLQKGASYPAVTDAEVRSQSIPIPPLLEQKRIVGILNEAFEGIATAKANTEKNLQSARGLFESHLNAVFSERDDGWVEESLDAVCNLIDCLHKTPTYVETGFPMVRVTDIKPGFLDLSKTRQVDKKIFNEFSKKHVPKRGDIVFSRVGSYGVSSFVNSDQPFCLGQNTVFIIPKINSRLLYYFLNSRIAKNQFDELVDGTTQPTISLKSIRKVRFAIPPSRNHEKLVAELEEISSETQRLESIYKQKLNALDELKKSLLNQAFTGEL